MPFLILVRWRSLFFIVIICVQLTKCKPAADINENNILMDEVFDFRSKYAEQMLSFMNLSIRPCDDFYEFACGNFKNVMKKRWTASWRSNIDDIIYEILDKVELMLERPNIKDIAPELEAEFQTAKQFYTNCRTSDLYPTPISEYYLDMLQTFGLSTWNSSEFSWLNVTAHLSNYGVETMLKEEMNYDYPYQPFFTIPKFGFDVELHNDTIRNKSSNDYQVNQKHMQKILTLYGVENDSMERIIADVLQFLESVLDMVAKFNGEVAKCHEMSEPLDIEKVYKRFLPYYDIVWMGKILDPTESLPCFYYFIEIDKICEKHKEAVANYLSMKFLYHMDTKLNNSDFQRDYCIFQIQSGFYFLFDHLYMKLYFDEEGADDIRSMFKMAHQSLLTLIQNADWLDKESRDAALLKAYAIKANIGRYEDYKTLKIFLDLLKDIKFNPGSFEANIAELKKFQVFMNRYYGLYAEKFDNTTKPIESLRAMEVNAYFFTADNTIYVKGGIMLPPAYHKHLPRSLKWGSIGLVLGHEMGHGYNLQGMNYDHEGNYKDTWTENSINTFKERVQCYQDHYTNYTNPTITEINKKIDNYSKDENVADGHGIRIAYTTYRHYMDEQMQNLSITEFEKEEKMPGIDLTPEQLLFLAGAQLFCSDTNITQNRVNGMFLNTKDFARVYKCSLGDNMNPSENKCVLL